MKITFIKFCAIFCLAITFLITGCSKNSFVVETSSMEPTISVGQKVILADNIEINRYDIVAFKPSIYPNQIWIMRVYGLPGETIFIGEDGVFINGAKIEALIDQDYTMGVEDQLIFGVNEGYEVHGDSYFLLGDNGLVSRDSRYIGCIDGSEIVGVIQE